MPQVTFTAKYRKNELAISGDDVLLLYFYGVNIDNATDGTKFSDETVRFYAFAAQQEIAKFLGIKFVPELITETQDYYRDDYYHSFPFVKVTYPVNKAYSMLGMINSVEQVVFPNEWLAVKKTSSNNSVWRQINVVPNGSTVYGNSEIIYTGIISQYGLHSNLQVPHYWTMQYTTGFSLNNLPYEILNVIGMLAAIPIFAIAGDLILGAGIASQSLSIDGLSQSISSTSSATNSGYGSRIIEYRKTIKETLDRIKRNYRGIPFTVC